MLPLKANYNPPMSALPDSRTVTAPIASASRPRAIVVLAALVVAALASIAIALATGSVAVDAGSLLQALAGEATDSRAAIVRELRLPRALAGFAVGGLLAVAGALMQVLLRNPLADPYVLGISGGAAVGASRAV